MPDDVGRRQHESAAHADAIAQQLPFLRPVGYDLAPEVADDLCDAIRSAHTPHLDGKKF